MLRRLSFSDVIDQRTLAERADAATDDQGNILDTPTSIEPSSRQLPRIPTG